MSKAVINGTKINYRSFGEGQDIVLLHGLAANHAFWRIDILLPLARDYRVTVYDLRGHGHSSMPPSGYTLTDMSEDLQQLLNHLEISKAHLIGHSFGGTIALHYATQHPDRISSLVVADSRVRAFQPVQRPRDWPNWEKVKKKFEELELFIPEDETDSGIWLLEQLASPKWRKERHKLKGSQLSVPFSKWGGGNHSAECWLKLLNTTTAKKDFTCSCGLTKEKLSSIKQPILAVYGENSTLMPSLRGLQRYLFNCKTTIIPKAGHFCLLTQPRLFLNIVSRFLKEAECLKKDVLTEVYK